MTRTLQLRSNDISRFSIGLDSMIKEMLKLENQPSGYPPHNIIELSESKTDIELAVAGFSKEEISISIDHQVLLIKGMKKDSGQDEKSKNYAWKGISTRDFERQFRLGEYVEVTTATIVDGILTVSLEQKIPEEKLPKQIAIE